MSWGALWKAVQIAYYVVRRLEDAGIIHVNPQATAAAIVNQLARDRGASNPR